MGNLPLEDSANWRFYAEVASALGRDKESTGLEMPNLFEKSEPNVEKTYAAILKAVAKFGEVRAEEKKTSIHLVAKTGFAGVHPRKNAVLLNIRTDVPIKSKRVKRLEQVSANRFHNELLVASPKEVDAELIGWLKASYSLAQPDGG